MWIGLIRPFAGLRYCDLPHSAGSHHEPTRYADPSQVRLALWRDSGLLIFEFEDDGRGFEVNQATQGLGLLGMRERARILGGRIEINSRQGNGTRITLEIPESAHADK